MPIKIVEPEDLTGLQISEFTDGFKIPFLKRMHYKSAGNGGIEPLKWPKLSYSQFQSITNDQLTKFCHYPEAIPSLETIDFGGKKTALVLGSSAPWLEIYLMKRGLKNILTVEYREIHWEVQVPSVSWDSVTYQKYESQLTHVGDGKTYDVVISYSSIEHSGLGRYGDSINPNGDLDALALISKNTSANSLILIAIPVGKDCILFNRHRVYGMQRLKKFAAILNRHKVRVCTPITNLVDQETEKNSHNLFELAEMHPIGRDGVQYLLSFEG
jgi:hypothetical protein